jgi:hypothetical protein
MFGARNATRSPGTIPSVTSAANFGEGERDEGPVDGCRGIQFGRHSGELVVLV